MSVTPTKSNQVFGNRFLNRAVLDFLPLQDQDRCKRINKVSNENAQALQRQRLLKEISPAWIESLGQDRLARATIMNWSNVVQVQKENLPASFVIGFVGKDTYAAVRTKVYIPGKCCQRCSLKVTGTVKNQVGYNLGVGEFRDAKPIHLRILLGGGTVPLPVFDTPSRCCSLRRIVSCFQRLFFENHYGIFTGKEKLD